MDKKLKLSPQKRIWLIRILILVLLCLAFYIGRVYQQNYLEEKLRGMTTTPTNTSPAPWRTYTDTINKITFQYPSDWVVSHSTKDMFISKKGSKTSVAFYYPTNPKANVQIPPSGLTEGIKIGSEKAVFTDYYTGLGNPATAYAQTKRLSFGNHIAAVGITIASDSDMTDAKIVKKILGSISASQ